MKEIEAVKNLQDFGDNIGTNKAGISDIKADRKKISVENLINLNEKFPVINIDWLITGKGSMIISYSKKDNSLSHVKEPEPIYNHTPNIVTVDNSGKENIVLVPVKAAAGYLNGFGDPEFIQSLPTYSIPNIQNGVFRMFQVNGHSMYPTLHSGAYVVGQFVENWIKDIKDDRVFILVSKNEGIVIKRCLNRISKYGTIYCKSDNRREYPSFAMAPSEILEVWEFKMALTWELSNPADIYERINDLEAKVNFLESRSK
ncbi:S24 family peptidase [Flavobacterium kingsejongi]|uniref:S24 family peptidase n=1 Tax=Flavobacterium kingsejongi TaxID=1678728 RepID=UPI001300754E|nr:S24 family peptidase [Flavobacterium kingsejongi]